MLIFKTSLSCLPLGANSSLLANLTDGPPQPPGGAPEIVQLIEMDPAPEDLFPSPIKEPSPKRPASGGRAANSPHRCIHEAHSCCPENHEAPDRHPRAYANSPRRPRDRDTIPHRPCEQKDETDSRRPRGREADNAHRRCDTVPATLHGPHQFLTMAPAPWSLKGPTAPPQGHTNIR